jgi:hypothetical protein
MNIGEPMTRANLKETAESAGGGMGTTQLKSQALNLFAEMSTVAGLGLINHGSRTPHFPRQVKSPLQVMLFVWQAIFSPDKRRLSQCSELKK